ncbi:hypothetical protein CC80DRAFT_526094 [Byssothecium circinans]|uniref:DNA polymerase delta subunit 3 n=1 Tax=Byssothecium circinans TaxID=147558 RepID=A0A6A5TTS1_9PLEO|nr:hypothetical protein CC80DRAFT_526094 [Byssothecium circinans]
MVAEDYKEFLAARVLTDNRPVTYRLLSRALKVNVNTAKRMLYEFHKKQNTKKPDSVHATYLLTGKKRTSERTNDVNGKDGEDVAMRSSPFMSSMPEPDEPVEEPVLKTSIVLVREEELESTKAKFEEITSIHVYSLESGPIENLNLLSLCNQEVATEYTSEEPLERWKAYGCIRNPYIKRRTTKYNPAPPISTAKPTAKPTSTTTATKGEKTAPGQRGSASEDNASSQSTPQPGPATAKSTSTLKRSDSTKSNAKKDRTVGDIFKSFAKAKPKAKEAAKPKEPEDEPMKGMSEDEGDDDEGPQVKIDEEKAAAARKAREERAEELRKMMEADIEMPDATPEPEKESQESINAASEQEAEAKPSESEPEVATQGEKRRGRRRVTKKKKVKDADGYLVTKEETVWESFSEDEPEPKKPKPTPKPAPSTAKGKKGAAKGQGNIASFFKKA